MIAVSKYLGLSYGRELRSQAGPQKKTMNDSVFLEMEQSISGTYLPPSKHVTQCGTHHAIVCHVEATRCISYANCASVMAKDKL